MKIGNENKSEFDATCIGCGSKSHLQMYAFRNRHREMTGWLFACEPCSESVTKGEIKWERIK